MSRHRLFDPEGMAPATGFSYGSIAGSGRLLHVAGITGHGASGEIDDDLVIQFHEACRSVVKVVEEAGGHPEDVVSLTIFTPAIDEYRSKLRPLGVAYRSVFGSHYPPMALFGISELFDPRALVELVAVAVVPEP